MVVRIASLCLLLTLLGACSAPAPREPLKGHLNQEQAQPGHPGTIPSPVRQPLALPPPTPAPHTETYSVVVHNIPVRDLLFALARDARLNVDIHPGISGNVTLNAIDQTLPQLLSRVSRQVELRFELDGPNLAVMPDSPFLRHYKVDYVNLSRNVSGTVATNTQIATGGSVGSTGNNGAESALGSGNISSTRVENSSRNQFWESLEKNIKDILRETDKILPEGSSEEEEEFAGAFSGTPQQQPASRAGKRNPTAQPALSEGQARGTRVIRRTTFREAASVIVHPESGVVTVRATGRQHERIQEFIDKVSLAAHRQVMIEATIVEVELGDGYQQGIEWSRIWASGDKRFGVTPTTATGGVNPSLTPFVLSFVNQANPLDMTLNLLQSFGTAKVLSSPRLSVLNNQTALLKVVENVVYFSIKADITPGNANTNAVVAYTTTPQTVSVGLVMTVTPQISDSDSIILNVRPTISSIAAMVKDPNPDIPSNVSNEIPQIRTREIESVLRVTSGDIAVLGGLMEDRIDYKTGRVPVLGQVPLAGELFTSRNNSARKSELVIFLRPIVIRDPSLQGDFSSLRPYLPDQAFFSQPPEAQPLNPALPPARERQP
ncbi:pilus (MSHA type) biogenesis protein MshL [Azovibrio restrictus]|uniref:pilus (MSHA type) biogenesis protein MshL n=1 Tax=Azovibrio restrictus TaxID=146938 RepID=UPI0026F11AA0|nr:pilus (MSHA type) biogenesis protein MshL [Azovibrio restrictus]MDD3481558.1 pilus (MSHA type) biogenesis protein MshL [Azovibrio restrictus]